ncbi:MAG: SDR family NAD(P)-dependent oxidoreductase [Deferrisomatales bacterium]
MLKGQVALVTGGARGIGRAIALALAGEGARVVVADLLEEDGRRTAAELGAAEGGGRFRAVDVTDADAVEALVAETVESLGRLDILVNNAGNTTHPAWCTDMSNRDWHAVIDVHVHGTFYCLKSAAKVMKKQRYGRIVNLSSVAAVHGFATQINYAAAKYAVLGMTLTAAKELAPHGITVNCLQPGVIRSDMTAILLQEGEATYVNRTPTRRIGEPADVAGAVRYLVSPAAAFVTGVSLRVDGGFALVLSPEADLAPIADAYPHPD